MDYPKVFFGLLASFAAPMLRILKAPNFIIDYWGHTSTGKTTALEVAASVWGSPHKETGGLIFSWDSTKVYLERLAGFFNDLPIFPDDSQTVDDRTLTKILYMVANGTGRGRGNITGIRQSLTWHTICFSTGERPLIDCTSFGGVKARTISLYGTPFQNASGSFVNDLKSIIRENYGLAGPLFIEKISTLWSDRTRLYAIVQEYSRYQRVFSDDANSEIGDRMSHYFAAVKVTADIVSEILGFDEALSEESIHKVFETAIAESAENSDYGTKALQYVLSWVQGNEKSFRGKGNEDYGIWKDNEYIGIYPHKLREVLQRENYNERHVIKIWADRNWLKRDDNKHLTCVRQVKGSDGYSRPKRLRILPWEIIQKFFDNKLS